MTNREVVDYILSNKLKERDVIKKIEKCVVTNEEDVTYIYNDGSILWDDNGIISIIGFKDEIPSLNGTINYSYIYEIIPEEQALKEVEIKDKKEKIQQLKDELERLEKEVS